MCGGRSKIIPSYRQLLKGTGLKGRVSSNGSEVTVHYPGGISTVDYTGRKAPSVHRLMGFMEAPMTWAFHIDDPETGMQFADLRKLVSDRTLFINCSSTYLEKAMYDVNVPKFPLELTMYLHYISKSTATLGIITREANTKIKLMTNINPGAYVDFDTHNAKPLPEWWWKKFSPFAKTKEPIIIPRPIRPALAQYYEFDVHWSDTDFNQHTNWSSYAKFFSDSAQHLNKKGVYKFTCPDVINYHAVKNVDIRYLAETSMGDEFKVYSWDSRPNLLEFDMVKKDGEVSVAYGTIDLYVPGEDIDILPDRHY